MEGGASAGRRMTMTAADGEGGTAYRRDALARGLRTYISLPLFLRSDLLMRSIGLTKLRARGRRGGMGRRSGWASAGHA